MRTSSLKATAFDPDGELEAAEVAKAAAAAVKAAPPEVEIEKPKAGFSARLRAAEGDMRKQEVRREASSQSDASVRRRLSALKALSPLMLALVKRPGFQAADGELHEAVQQMRTETERASKDLLLILGAEEPAPWLRGMSASIVAEAVAAEWEAGAKTLDMSPYQPIWGHLAEADFADFSAHLPDLGGNKDEDMMLRLSVLKAMSQVVAVTRRSYLMRHDPEKLYPMLADVIMQVSKNNLSKLVDNQTSEGARLMALQSLIGKSADLLCAHWDGVVRPTVKKLISMQKEDRLALYRKHPEGLPLDVILTGFSADVARVVSGLSLMDPRVKTSVDIGVGD